MKLNEYIETLCSAFSDKVGCGDCPHIDNCCGALAKEINEKTDFELDFY